MEENDTSLGFLLFSSPLFIHTNWISPSFTPPSPLFLIFQSLKTMSDRIDVVRGVVHIFHVWKLEKTGNEWRKAAEDDIWKSLLLNFRQTTAAIRTRNQNQFRKTDHFTPVHKIQNPKISFKTRKLKHGISNKCLWQLVTNQYNYIQRKGGASRIQKTNEHVIAMWGFPTSF